MSSKGKTGAKTGSKVTGGKAGGKKKAAPSETHRCFHC